jgi:hypothetical protein
LLDQFLVDRGLLDQFLARSRLLDQDGHYTVFAYFLLIKGDEKQPT